MKRRDVLNSVSAALLHAALPASALANTLVNSEARAGVSGAAGRTRARPGTAQWPNAQAWESLRTQTGGRLQALTPPFADCGQDASACAATLDGIKDPYFIGDHPALTQTSGWQDAWTSQASAWAVAARDAKDVAAAVRFARTHNLRLVVKGVATATWAAPTRPIRCWCGRAP